MYMLNTVNTINKMLGKSLNILPYPRTQFNQHFLHLYLNHTNPRTKCLKKSQLLTEIQD